MTFRYGSWVVNHNCALVVHEILGPDDSLSRFITSKMNLIAGMVMHVEMSVIESQQGELSLWVSCDVIM